MGAATTRRPAATIGWLRATAVAAVVVAVDQVTKAIVRADVRVGDEHELLSFLSIGHVHNRGVAFGLLSGGHGAIVVIVPLVALALLLGYFARHAGRPLLWLPTGMLVGGAIGNLVDRLRQGYVTDFITLPHWPSFNVADVGITVGVVILILVVERHARTAGA